MKKLVMIIALSLCVLSQLYAQSLYRIYLVRSGPYNQYTEKFDIKERAADMTMEFNKSVIRLSDNARSVYITRNYREVRDDADANIAGWDGIDERGRDVSIYMTFNKRDGTHLLSVLYSDFIFQYYFYE